MSQYPTVKAKEFIKIIEKLGFYFEAVMLFIRMMMDVELLFLFIREKI